VLDNGVRVMVPPHISSGTRIVVDVYNREYVRRAE
jgi:elongation factor P